MARPRPRVSVSEAAVASALREVDGRTRLVVTAKPKSAKEGVEDGADGALVVRVNAPPVDGQANARIVEVVAAVLGVAKGEVAIVRGETARHKELEVGLPLAETRARLLA